MFNPLNQINMGLSVKKVRSYRSKKGNVTFVYEVSGDEKSIADFKKAQGEFFRESEKGVPLWFTTKFIGERGTLIVTEKGTITPDMSKFDAAASIASQYGGNLGQELAKQAAADLLGNSGNTAAPAMAPAAEAAAPAIGNV